MSDVGFYLVNIIPILIFDFIKAFFLFYGAGVSC